MDKSFEALYKIAMAMADTCVKAQDMPARILKIREEFDELMIELECENKSQQRIKGELGDVLFVLLHIAHKMDTTPFELLHQATSKMLSRMNDKGYIAKN